MTMEVCFCRGFARLEIGVHEGLLGSNNPYSNTSALQQAHKADPVIQVPPLVKPWVCKSSMSARIEEYKPAQLASTEKGIKTVQA